MNHTPEDVSRENLKAMCAPCHLKYDAWHHAETRKNNVGAEQISMIKIRGYGKAKTMQIPITDNSQTNEEMAFNACFVKDGQAMFRDFEKEYDIRELFSKLVKNLTATGGLDVGEDFDGMMYDMLMEEPMSIEWLLAISYRNMWAMAEMREALKKSEQL